MTADESDRLRGRSRPRSQPHSRRSGRDPTAGRPRRRCDQDRAAGSRRRHAPVGAALAAPAPDGTTDRRERLFPQRQPQQALGDASTSPGRKARSWCARWPRGATSWWRTSRSATSLASASTTPSLQPDAAAPRLLLDHRFRPDRPLRAARRLRLPGAGPGRHHEHHRRAGRAADEGRRRRRRRRLRPLRGDRHPGGASPPRQHRRGPAHRPRPARYPGGLARQPGAQLSDLRHRRRRGSATPIPTSCPTRSSRPPTATSSWPSATTASSAALPISPAQPELASDPRFATNPQRVRHRSAAGATPGTA